MPRSPGRDDQIVRPGRGDHGGLLASQDVILAVAPCRGRDIGEIKARALFGPGQGPNRRAGDDVGNEALLLLLGACLLEQAAGEHHCLDERLDYKMTAELLHDDHGRQKAAAKTTDLLGEWRGEQTELGERSPLLRLNPSSLAAILRRASKSY